MADPTPVETAVLDAVDEDWLVDRLRRLVAVPSVGGTAAECDVQHLVADWLDELGCDVDRWPIDLTAAAAAADAPGQEVDRDEAWGVVGTLPAADDGTPALVLSGHTDVVPASDPARWPGDPFRPRLVDGAVHGRGACDMKAGVVAALGALAAVRTAGVRLARPVAVHSVVGEEDGGLGAWATLARGHRGDVRVIPEPTAGTVGKVAAGDWASSVPDRLVAEGRYGVRLDEPVAAAREALEARVAAFCTVHPWLAAHPVRVTWFGGSFAGGQTSPGHRLLSDVRSAVADAGGGIPPEGAVTAGSDLRIYAAAGVPTLHYGPGDLRLAHGPREKVPVAEVVTAARAFALLAVRTAAAR